MARRSHKVVAIECMRNELSCKHALTILCRLIHKEIRSIASRKMQSTLLFQSKKSISEFQWKNVKAEISNHAPMLLKVLTAATKTRSKCQNQAEVIGMCFAMILKHRNPNLNLLQKIISLILFSGHASKQVCYTLRTIE